MLLSLFYCLCSQVHAYIISALHKEMPAIFRKDGKKKELIKNLGNIYQNIQREQQISPGDFPELKKMQVKNIVLTSHATNLII